MSLNFSYEKVADRAPFIDAKTNEWTTLGQTLPFVAMVAGLGRITEKNAGEFFARVTLLERVYGPYRTDWQGHPVYFNSEEVRQAVGFSCNVRDETRAAFLKRAVAGHMDDAVRSFARRKD